MLFVRASKRKMDTQKMDKSVSICATNFNRIFRRPTYTAHPILGRLVQLSTTLVEQFIATVNQNLVQCMVLPMSLRCTVYCEWFCLLSWCFWTLQFIPKYKIKLLLLLMLFMLSQFLIFCFYFSRPILVLRLFSLHSAAEVDIQSCYYSQCCSCCMFVTHVLPCGVFSDFGSDIWRP